MARRTGVRASGRDARSGARPRSRPPHSTMLRWRGRRTSGIILPGYARFAETARAFADQAGALCKAPSPAALDDTRARGARGAPRLGPHRAAALRPHHAASSASSGCCSIPTRTASSPSRPPSCWPSATQADIEPEKLAGASVAVQGFGAVDAVLYGNGSEALATAAPEASFRCRYVHALAARHRADRRRDARRVGGRLQAARGLHPGGGNKTYLTAKETTQALYRAYVTEIEVIARSAWRRCMGGERQGRRARDAAAAAQRPGAAVHPRHHRRRARHPRR